MYSPPPDPAIEQRMRAHHHRAASALAAMVEPGGEFWGWAGRTLGTPARTTAGTAAWLRLVSAPQDKASGKLWEGAREAQQTLGSLHGRRPALIGLHDVTEDGVAYRVELPPDLHAMISTLAPGERSPVFLMGTSWDRHAWYLRLPCTPGAPWAGVVRLECAADISASAAIDLANLSQVVLPRYASIEYKDTRAPQNLVPVAGLERQLRRHLGNPVLLSRALRVPSAR